jgi:hypothetical protein
MRLNTPTDRHFRLLGFLSSRLLRDLKSARPIVPVRSAACLELFCLLRKRRVYTTQTRAPALRGVALL